VTEV